MPGEFLLVGGDERQRYLAELLASFGPTATLCVPSLPDTAQERAYENLILPCPAFLPDGRLRGRELPSGALEYYAARARRVFGGQLQARREALERLCGEVTDLLEDEALLLENAALTAEAALALTVTETRRALYGSRCLTLGWGRIAKRLCLLLRGHGAEVAVAARSDAARTEAALYGFRALAPAEVRPEYALVFNTVPARCLPETTLWGFSPDCLWVELASAPGGLPEQARLPLRVLHANGLPGRLVPRSAAQVLYRGIGKHLG